MLNWKDLFPLVKYTLLNGSRIEGKSGKMN